MREVMGERESVRATMRCEVVKREEEEEEEERKWKGKGGGKGLTRHVGVCVDQ